MCNVKRADWAYPALSAASLAAVRIAEGRADVGIFVPPQHDGRLSSRHYRDGELAVLVPRDHVLARRTAPAGAAPPGVPFDALLDFDIVGLHLGAAVHEQMRERAQALGRTLNVRLQVRGFDAIAQLVEAGLGVAVLPAVVAQRFARIFAVQPLVLQEDWACRDYLLAVRRRAGARHGGVDEAVQAQVLSLAACVQQRWARGLGRIVEKLECARCREQHGARGSIPRFRQCSVQGNDHIAGDETPGAHAAHPDLANARVETQEVVAAIRTQRPAFAQVRAFIEQQVGERGESGTHLFVLGNPGQAIRVVGLLG